MKPLGHYAEFSLDFSETSFTSGHCVFPLFWSLTVYSKLIYFMGTSGKSMDVTLVSL